MTGTGLISKTLEYITFSDSIRHKRYQNISFLLEIVRFKLSVDQQRPALKTMERYTYIHKLYFSA